VKLSGVGQFRLERAARAGLQHCPQCRAQGRDRRGQARTHILKHTGVPHLVQRGVPLVNGPTVCRAPGLPFYLVLRRGIDRAGGQSHFRPVLKTFQSRGECQISPDMALGTTGLNPDPEGLIFGVCQISASQDRLCTSPRLRVYPRQANPDLLARVGGRMRGEGRAASGDGMILSTTTESCCSYLKP